MAAPPKLRTHGPCLSTRLSKPVNNQSRSSTNSSGASSDAMLVYDTMLQEHREHVGKGHTQHSHGWVMH